MPFLQRSTRNKHHYFSSILVLIALCIAASACTQKSNSIRTAPTASVSADTENANATATTSAVNPSDDPNLQLPDNGGPAITEGAATQKNRQRKPASF